MHKTPGQKYLPIVLSAMILSLTAGVNFAYSKTTTIKMYDDFYELGNITIESGDTVLFKNYGSDDRWPASNIHPTHEIYSEFDPRHPISPGKDWVFVFDKTGIWRYHDHLDPQITGTISVVTGADIDSSQKETSRSFSKRLLSPFKYIYEKIISFLKKEGISGQTEKRYASIAKDSKEIFSNEEALKNYIREYGPKETIQRLNVLSTEFGSCHDTAHRAGRISYELLNDKAFKECGAECHSGCYHGATEAYFKEHGTANLSKNLNTLCGNELNFFFSHQCIHGIGHGLMAWANYEINDALKSCDFLSQRQDSCWTGVFMENIVGGLTDKKNLDHFTKYLSSDPQYPCNIVDEKYKSSCYFLQTSRMVQLFANDFSKVATACLKAPAVYQHSCFSSMGRDVGGVNRKNPEGAIKACSYTPIGQLRTACLLGAAQDTFWDPTGQDDAILFCKLLEDKAEKDACYNTISLRAREVLPSKEDIKIFCNKAENEYQSLCSRR